MHTFPDPISREHKEVDGKFVIIENYADGTHSRTDVQTGIVQLYNPAEGKVQTYVPSGNEGYWLQKEEIHSDLVIQNVEREWYENGQIKFEHYMSGTTTYWYENGNKKLEELPDGTKREWNQNGTLILERLPSKGIGYVYEYDKTKKEVILPTGVSIKMQGAPSPFKDMKINCSTEEQCKTRRRYLPEGALGGDGYGALGPYKMEVYQRNYTYTIEITGTKGFDNKFSDTSFGNEYLGGGRWRRHDNSDVLTTKTLGDRNGCQYTIDFKRIAEKRWCPLLEIEVFGATYKFSSLYYGSLDGYCTSRKDEDGSFCRYDEKGTLRYEELNDKTKIYRNSKGNIISIYLPNGTEYHWDNEGKEITCKREFSGYDLFREIKSDGTKITYGDFTSIELPDGTFKRYDKKLLIEERLPDGTEREWDRYSERLLREKLPDNSEQKWNSGGKILLKRLADGTEYRWFEDGKIRSYFDSKGIGYSFYTPGQKSVEVLADGTKHEWYENGNQKLEELPNGTKREWYENGKQKLEELPDGTKREWYENGNQKLEELPDGTKREWYGDGTMHEEIIPGAHRVWYANGNLFMEVTKGIKREWYENGNLEFEKLPDGTEREWYENGNHKCEKLPDGTECEWYENGNPKYEKRPDGTTLEWNEDNLKEVKLPDGSYTVKNGYGEITLADGTMQFYAKGKLRKEELPDGTINCFHPNGQMSEQNLPDGTVNYFYTNGQMYEQKSPDGSINHFYPDGRPKQKSLDSNSNAKDGTYEITLADETKQYYEEGILDREETSDGIFRFYGHNGTLKNVQLPDGTINHFHPNGQMSEQKLPDGSSFGWYQDGMKKFEEHPNGSREEWHPNGKLATEIVCSQDKRIISIAKYNSDGKVTHFEHHDKEGNDDTRIYLAKKRVAQNRVEKSAKKGKTVPKMNQLQKALKIRRALKKVDKGR